MDAMNDHEGPAEPSISVEAGPRVDADPVGSLWVRGGGAFGGSECPHRSSWGDLRASRKILCAVVASMAGLCIAAAAAGFVWGLGQLTDGDGDRSEDALAVTALVCAFTMAFGVCWA
ncbi:hypothetical protein [Glycomyces tarimensis]